MTFFDTVNILSSKKLKSFFLSFQYYFFMFLFLLICGLIFSNSFFFLGRSDAAYLKEALPFILIFFVPAFACKGPEYAVSGFNRERIFSLPVSDTEIVISHWFSSFAAAAANFILFAFYFSAAYVLGAPDNGETAGFFIGAVLLASFFSSAGVFFSVISSTFFYSYAYSVLFLILISFLEIFSPLLPSAFRFLSYAGFLNRFEYLASGFIRLEDAAYFFIFTSLFIFLAVENLKIRRGATCKKSFIKQITAFIFACLLTAGVSHIKIKADITENKSYSLSSQTKKSVSQLKENFVIEFYKSPNLPPQLESQAFYAEIILKEFAQLNEKVKLEIIYVDSQKNRDRAILNSVSPVKFEIISEDRTEQTQGFLGLSLKYLDKKKSVPFLSDASFLEYELISSLISLTQPKKNLIFLKNTGISPDFINPYAIEKLKDIYEIKTLSAKEIFQETKESVMVIMGPDKPLPEKELAITQSFISSGGKALIAPDIRKPDEYMNRTYDNYCGLERFFEVNGAKIENFLIMDKDCDYVRINSPSGVSEVSYPLYPAIRNINRTHPAFKNINRFFLPLSSPISLSQKEGVTLSPLAFSSPASWIRTSNKYHSISPFSQELIKNDDDKRGPFAVAVLLNGFLTPDPYLLSKYPSFFREHKKETAVLLISGSKFLYYPSSGAFENLSLFLNCLEYLSGYHQLSNLRAKSDRIRPLIYVADSDRLKIKYAIFFIPLLFCAALFIYVYKKRKIAYFKVRDYFK